MYEPNAPYGHQIETTVTMSIDQNNSDDGWNEAESPTQQTLHDVVSTASNPYAVGGNGYVLVRRDDEWEPVLERGPKVDSNTLRSAAVSEDGEHVWFTGDSGVLARYRVTGNDQDSCSVNDRLVDYSRTYDITTTWESIAVMGTAGKEQILLSNASGEVLLGENDGEDLTWGDTMKPGGGSSLSGFDFVDEETGYACDTSGTIYETTDGGESYETIGAEAAPALNGISAVESEDITVIASSGNVFRYNGTVWTERHVGNEELIGIDFNREDSTGLICGSNGGIYTLGENGWTSDGTPTTDQLNSITISSTAPHIAVGTSGTIVEM